MKKELIGIFLCVLLVVTVLPATGNITMSNQNKDNFLVSDIDSVTYKWGLIFGPIGEMEYEDDLIVIRATDETRGDLHFIIPFFRDELYDLPFLWDELWGFQQIKIQYKFGILRNNFILGFAKICIPELKISMSIVDHNDTDNKVTWEVDEIIGASIWGGNIQVRLLNESGGGVSGTYWQSYAIKYLSVGDRLSIQPMDGDGLYRIVVSHAHFRNVLYESDYIEF
jgi:hypothetical protein